LDATNLSAGKYNYNCYIAVGTLDEVTQAVKSLINNFHPAGTTSNLHNPTGSLDGVGNNAAGGWAYDVDTSTQSVIVQFYADSIDSNHLLGQTVTNSCRTDVNSFLKRPTCDPAAQTGELHGYNFTIPATFANGTAVTSGNHNLYAVAMDTGKDHSKDSQLPGSPKMFSSSGTSTPVISTNPTSTVITPPTQPASTSSGDTPPGSTQTPNVAVPISYPYPSGSLVNDGGTIYFISGQTKIPFTNWQAFVGLGYLPRNVVIGDLSAYTLSSSYFITTANMAHPWGSWLFYKGTIYYSSQQGLIGIPSYDIFLQNGGQLKYVVPANKDDIVNIQNSLQPLKFNDNRVNR
jgi:hypothetical protein